MPSLREKLWGKIKPLREKLGDLIAPASTITYAQDKPKQNVNDVPLLDANKKPAPAEPVKVEDGVLVPQKSPMPTKPEPKKPLRTFDEPFIGTNYDPYDPEQTRPNPDGKGKAGIKMTDDMVATALKEDGLTGNLRLGTVIRVPSLDNQVFLVTDTMNKRFNGMNKLDFVRANKKKTPDPTVNKEFSDIEILREGAGPEDARKFVESGDWKKFKQEHSSSYQEKLNTTLPPLDDIKDERWQDPTQEQLNAEKVQFDKERGVMISAYRPKLTQIFSNVIDKVKGKIPGVNTNMEKAMKDEIAKNYPLTPEARKTLNEVDMNFVKKDSLLGGKAGATHQNIRGDKTAKVFNKIWENPILDRAMQKVPPRLYRLLMGENIKLDDSNAEVAFHEGLHAIFARKDIDPEQFLNDWEAAKNESSTAEVYGPVHDLMNYLEEKVGGGIYEGNNNYETVNEMYAYLGSIAGGNGLDAIPGSLRKYYEDTLLPMDREKKQKGNKKIRDITLNDLSKPSSKE
jgi:hypothetical protein